MVRTLAQATDYQIRPMAQRGFAVSVLFVAQPRLPGYTCLIARTPSASGTGLSQGTSPP